MIPWSRVPLYQWKGAQCLELVTCRDESGPLGEEQVLADVPFQEIPAGLVCNGGRGG